MSKVLFKPASAAELSNRPKSNVKLISEILGLLRMGLISQSDIMAILESDGTIPPRIHP